MTDTFELELSDSRDTGRCREAVSLAYRLQENGPGFMVIDATEREFAKSELVSLALSRERVIGQPIARHVFALCDTILARDARVAELLGGWTVDPPG